MQRLSLSKPAGGLVLAGMFLSCLTIWNDETTLKELSGGFHRPLRLFQSKMHTLDTEQSRNHAGYARLRCF